MSKVSVIGGGAAGMMAAIASARIGNKVTIYEKNEKLGKKIYITGKGRCNITNACDVEDLFLNVPRNNKFLYSAFYTFTNQDVMDFFADAGLQIKVERGNRVFPVSDHSSDVIEALSTSLEKLGVTVRLNTPVKGISIKEKKVEAIELKDGNVVKTDHVIIATGGFSYQSTGSTGDGYVFAKESGHEVTKISPSLVPIETKEDYVKELQGLSLKNITVSIYNQKKKLFEESGEMLFTHFGVSGPLILSASSIINEALQKEHLRLEIDLKPALSKEQLDKRVLRDFEENMNKQFKNSIQKLFPAKLIPIMIELSGIDPDTKIHEITKEQRMNFVDKIKAFPMTLTGFREFKEAIITRGGVSVKDINPSNMESKHVKNLYFAGEVLDCDAYTGGFNLQIAWSTGYLAGISIEK